MSGKHWSGVEIYKAIGARLLPMFRRFVMTGAPRLAYQMSPTFLMARLVQIGSARMVNRFNGRLESSLLPKPGPPLC